MSTLRKRSVHLNVEILEDRLVPTASWSLANGTLKIVADNANDYIRVYQNNGIIGVAGNNVGWSASAIKQVVVESGGGNDTVDLRGLQVQTTVNGGSGHDILIGGENRDYLDGGDNDDRLFGMGGNDVLRGGNHDDRLFGGAGYDYLYGGFGRDYMWDGSTSSHEFYAAENDYAVDFIADMLAPSTGFSAAHVDQSSGSNSCAFLSVLGSMAQAGVNMRDYISFRGHDDNGVGQYDVKLFDGRQWRTFRVLFEGHTTATDVKPTADYASWAIIMQRAWYQFHGNTGSLPHVAMQALGRQANRTSTFNDNTFNAIVSSLANRRWVACGTGSQTISQLEERHAYTVVWAGWYNGVRCVQVRNPWGHDGGNGNDGNTRDGLIMLTWSQFASGMDYLAIG